MDAANDTYVITAADLVPSTWTGRAWSAQLRAWENVTNRDLTPGNPWSPKYDYRILRGARIRVRHTGGGLVSGVRVILFVIVDPVHTSDIIVLKDSYQSASRLVNWLGSTPLAAGIGWRIVQGGVAAGDSVEMCATYE